MFRIIDSFLFPFLGYWYLDLANDQASEKSLQKQGVFVFRYFDADLYRHKALGRNFNTSRSSGYDARVGSSAQAYAVQVKNWPNVIWKVNEMSL